MLYKVWSKTLLRWWLLSVRSTIRELQSRVEWDCPACLGFHFRKDHSSRATSHCRSILMSWDSRVKSLKTHRGQTVTSIWHSWCRPLSSGETGALCCASKHFELTKGLQRRTTLLSGGWVKMQRDQLQKSTRKKRCRRVLFVICQQLHTTCDARSRLWVLEWAYLHGMFTLDSRYM